MYELKQSTALTIPFFAHDANGDGVTGIADASWTKRISKNAGAFAAMTVTITEMENGWYSLPLSAAHTDTLGILAVSLSAAAAKRVNLVWRVAVRIADDLAFPNVSGRGMDVDAAGGVEVGSFQAAAITAAAFAIGAIDAAAVATDAIGSAEFAQAAADKIWASATRALTDKVGFDLTAAAKEDIIKAVSGTADSGSTTTIVDAERTEADTDYWKGSFVVMTSGPSIGQVRRITAFNAATDTITVVPAFTQAIAVGNTYLILRTAGAEVFVDAIKAAAISAVTFAANAIDAAAIATGAIDADSIAAAAITAAKFAAGAIDAAAIGTGAVDADSLATDAVNEIADGLLKRDFTGQTGEAARSMLNALRKLINKWSISGTTLTVTKEDDVATAYTQTITATPGADPITALDTV